MAAESLSPVVGVPSRVLLVAVRFVAIMVGMIIVGPLLTQLAANAGVQLVIAHGSDETFEANWLPVPDLTVPAIGVAMLLIALILRTGERLQRDTDGLV